MAYQFTFEPIAANWPLLVQGAALTLALTAVSATVGLAVGILGAVSRQWRLPFLHPFFTAYVECVRNTPFIVQLYFIYFGLPALGVRLNGWEASVLAMVVNLGAYSTEIIRAGVAAVPKGLIEAAKAAGKQVKVQMIPNGHNQMTESPDATLFAVHGFLNG